MPALEGRTGLAFGMGRSYGDVCLNPEGLLWLTRGMDRLIHWDEAAGRLNCEAGVLLRDIQRLMVPRGWMLPVTPGTQLVTVGGAIANDVHGKNHHRFGSFGDQLISLELLRTNGTRLRCSRDEHRELFLATLGGLGLTGVVLEATLHLRRVEGPWVDAEDLPFKGLDAFFELADASEAGWEHTVAWIDCLSGADVRGIFSRGNMSPEPADAAVWLYGEAVPRGILDAQQAALVQAVQGQGGLDGVAAGQRQLDHLVVGELARGVAGHHEGDVDDAVLDQLELRRRAFAQGAAGVDLDVEAPVGLLAQGVRPGGEGLLHQGADRRQEGAEAQAVGLLGGGRLAGGDQGGGDQGGGKEGRADSGHDH